MSSIDCWTSPRPVHRQQLPDRQQDDVVRWSVWLVSAVAATFAAQDQPLRDPRVFHASIDLVSVTVTVLDHDGRLVTDLPRDVFDVYEDGEAQTVTQFTRERVPISVGILIDTSDSMFGRRIQDAREAVERFVIDLLHPADEFAIVAFNHQSRLITRWTSDHESLSSGLQRLRPSGATAVYDAIISALPLVDVRHRQRAALLVLSDGADTASDRTLRDVRFALLRSDAFVYAVAIDSPDRRPINAAVNTTTLREITDQSGGRTETIHDSGELLDALSRISEELNGQYLLGYTSPKRADGQYHSIRVRIRGTDHRVRARNGYVVARRPPAVR
jgi:Ca-activated chloride channel family protein